MNKLNAFVLAALLGLSGMSLPAADAPAAPAIPAATETAPAVNIKKLRGKLLYKRNQISKLERDAMAANAELESQISGLEQQRRHLLATAQPKLGALYAEEAELRQQIREASPAKK